MSIFEFSEAGASCEQDNIYRAEEIMICRMTGILKPNGSMDDIYDICRS